MGALTKIAFLALCARTILAAPIKLVSQDFAASTVIFDLGDARYMTPLNHPYATVAGKKVLKTIANTPTVALWFNTTSDITKTDVEKQLDFYYSKDDVLTGSFLSSIIVTASSSASVSTEAVEYLKELGVDSIYIDGSIKKVPSSKGVETFSIEFTYRKYEEPFEGPFLAQPTASGAAFYPVYRLYVDEFRDFVL